MLPKTRISVVLVLTTIPTVGSSIDQNLHTLSSVPRRAGSFQRNTAVRQPVANLSCGFGACIHRSDKFMLRKAVTAKFMRQHTIGKDENTISDGGRLSGVAGGKENDPS
jgi:hypothetical protein